VAQGFYLATEAGRLPPRLDTARSALDSARSQSQAQQPNGVEVTLATTRIQQAQAAVGAARARLNRLRIVSPVDAVVLARHAEPGALAQPGKVLLSLASTGQWPAH
jgi:HlyD family secretion protein